MSLRLIISPAKRMRPVEGPPFAQTEPQFLSDAVSLARQLRSLSYVELRELWGAANGWPRRMPVGCERSLRTWLRTQAPSRLRSWPTMASNTSTYVHP